GKKRCIRIGEHPALGVEAARDIALIARRQVSNGTDPATVRQQAASVPTLADFIRDHYLPHCQVHLRRWKDSEARLRLHVLPKLGKFHLDQISRRLVQQWINQMYSSAKTMATANRAISALGAVMTFAVRSGCSDASPVRDTFRKSEGPKRYRAL